MAKKHADDTRTLRSDDPEKPASTGPTVARVEDAPILQGHEGEAYETVELTDGPGEGARVRVGLPLPLVIVANGERYLRSQPHVYVRQAK